MREVPDNSVEGASSQRWIPAQWMHSSAVGRQAAALGEALGVDACHHAAGLAFYALNERSRLRVLRVQLILSALEVGEGCAATYLAVQAGGSDADAGAKHLHQCAGETEVSITNGENPLAPERFRSASI